MVYRMLLHGKNGRIRKFLEKMPR